MLYGVIILVLCAGAAAGVGWMRYRQSEEFRFHAALARSIQLRSNAFLNGESIPDEYTCRGEGISPPLAWLHLPPNSKSLVLMVTDEELPVPAFPLFNIVHWVLINIPAGTDGFPAGVAEAELAKAGIRSLPNWSRETGYYPPCPLYGNHRYAFRIYALDMERMDAGIRNRSGLLKAMRGHILAYGEWNGYCRR